MSNPLAAITAKAKQSLKQDKERRHHQKTQRNSNKKRSTSKNNKRRINKNDKNPSPLKRRKFNKKKGKRSKSKGSIAFDLTLEEQKKRSVIKLENMPTGMEDHQISTFFKQFGTVTRYCLKRHRYGRSLRYAYVEFNHPRIAQIVAETLDVTSMYGSMLICKEIAPEKVDGSSFFRNHTIAKARRMKKFDSDLCRWYSAATIGNLEFQFPQWHANLLKDEQMINENLKEHNIDYQFDGFKTEIDRQIEKLKNEKNIDYNYDDLKAAIAIANEEKDDSKNEKKDNGIQDTKGIQEMVDNEFESTFLNDNDDSSSESE